MQETTTTTTATPAIEKNLELYVIEIGIVKAEDLIKSDLIGSSDPFCTVTANGQSFSTKVIQDNLAPQWNEKTQFCFFEKVNTLEFDVFDWDKNTKHDKIGDCKLDITEYFKPNHEGFNGELTLLNVKSGKITIHVKCRLILPEELEKRIQHLKLDNSNKTELIKKNDSEINHLKSTEDSATNTKKGLKKDEDFFKQKKSTLEKNINEQNENNNRLKDEINNYRNNIILSLKNTINNKENELNDINNNYNNKQNEYNRNLQEKEEALKNLQTLQSTLKSLKSSSPRSPRSQKKTLEEPLLS